MPKRRRSSAEIDVEVAGAALADSSDCEAVERIGSSTRPRSSAKSSSGTAADGGGAGDGAVTGAGAGGGGAGTDGRRGDRSGGRGSGIGRRTAVEIRLGERGRARERQRHEDRAGDAKARRHSTILIS